ANYLQRIGRAGRKTGNAMCVTVANARPHDLYYLARPREMMAGKVDAPGCFLDAPEMLKRQLVAHAMDAWAREEAEKVRIPQRTSLVLGEAQWAVFPGRFFEFYRARWAKLFDGFAAMFGDEVTDANRELLREFAGPGNVEAQIRGAFDAIRKERDELRALGKRLGERLAALEIGRASCRER